jgi:hypothetical protein
MSAASVPVGVLYDFPQGDGGRYFEDGLQIGFAEQRVEERLGAISLIARHADGLPAARRSRSSRPLTSLIDEGGRDCRPVDQ